MRTTHVAVVATEGGIGGMRGASEREDPRLLGGRWVFDHVARALNGADFAAGEPVHTRRGWSIPVNGPGRAFTCIVVDLSPVLTIEIVEESTFLDRLRGAERDARFERAFRAIWEALRADARVREVAVFSGAAAEAKTFVRSTVERLERALGIWSD